jgi:hypothetical protein
VKTAVFMLLVALGASSSAAGTLAVDATLITSRTSSRAFCPPATGSDSVCLRYVGAGSIAGLGKVTSTYTKVITMGDAACEVQLLSPVVIEAVGKGKLELSRPGRTCWRFALPARLGPLDFTVTGGGGSYAGATGSVTFKTNVAVRAEGERGASFDTWTGTVAAPLAEFDITPPVIAGATFKTVRAPRRAKRVRVRYAVTAQDAVDGPVPVECFPSSGTPFRLGKTPVTCSATDSSANTREARFTITVRKAVGR